MTATVNPAPVLRNHNRPRNWHVPQRRGRKNHPKRRHVLLHDNRRCGYRDGADQDLLNWVFRAAGAALWPAPAPRRPRLTMVAKRGHCLRCQDVLKGAARLCVGFGSHRFGSLRCSAWFGRAGAESTTFHLRLLGTRAPSSTPSATAEAVAGARARVERRPARAHCPRRAGCPLAAPTAPSRAARRTATAARRAPATPAQAGARLCLAPLAPVASLRQVPARSSSPPCTPPTTQPAGPSAPSPWATTRTGSRSTAPTCGSPTYRTTPSPSFADRRDARHLRRGRHRRQGLRSMARTCGSSTLGRHRHRAFADGRDARHLRCGQQSRGDRVRRHEHVGHQLLATTRSPSCRRRARRSAPSPWAAARRASRSTARTCGSPTAATAHGHRALADGRDARHLPRGRYSRGDRVRRHEHVGHQLQ